MAMKAKKIRSLERKKSYAGYFFVLPFIIGVCFLFLPMIIEMIRLSFSTMIKPTVAGLKLAPCLPPEWMECSITKVFRGATYVVRYHSGAAAPRLLVNGAPYDGEVLPLASPGETLTVDAYL